jgi:hypothetical protein
MRSGWKPPLVALTFVAGAATGWVLRQRRNAGEQDKPLRGQVELPGDAVALALQEAGASARTRFRSPILLPLALLSLAAAAGIGAIWLYEESLPRTPPVDGFNFGSIEIGTSTPGLVLNVTNEIAEQDPAESGPNLAKVDGYQPLSIEVAGPAAASISIVIVFRSDARMTRNIEGAVPIEAAPQRVDGSGGQDFDDAWIVDSADTQVVVFKDSFSSGSARFTLKGQIAKSFGSQETVFTDLSFPDINVLSPGSGCTTISPIPPGEDDPCGEQQFKFLPESIELPGVWYRPKALTVVTDAGHLLVDQTVTAVEPPLLDNQRLRWTRTDTKTASGSSDWTDPRVLFVRLRSFAQESELQRKTFFAGSLAGIAGGLLVEGTLASLRLVGGPTRRRSWDWPGRP